MQSKLGVSDSISITVHRPRYVKDGMVGVVISPDYGGGFSTWAPAGTGDMCMDVKVVEWTLALQTIIDTNSLEYQYFIDNITHHVKNTYDYSWIPGPLQVVWVPMGTKFTISEYDGWETLKTEHDFDWKTA